jgi:hypothetical protein
MAKRRAENQTDNLTPYHQKSRINPTQCVHVECNTLLKSFQGELQVFFRPHPNQRFEQRVINLQSPGSLNGDSFKTPPWES